MDNVFGRNFNLAEIRCFHRQGFGFHHQETVIKQNHAAHRLKAPGCR
jgi:hypothetical protein